MGRFAPSTMLAILDLLFGVLNVVSLLDGLYWFFKWMLWLSSPQYRREVRETKPDDESAYVVGTWAAGLAAMLIILVVGVFALASWLTGASLTTN